MFDQIFSQQDGKTFLSANGKNFSYGWLAERVRRTIAFFQAQQLKAGDRLLLAVSDDVEMSVLFLSALRSGIVVIVSDPEMKSPRANAICRRSAPAAIIADKESLDRWELQADSSCRVIPFNKEIAKPGLLSKFLKKNKTATGESPADYHGLIEKASPVQQLPPVPSKDQLAYIIFTSGTTADSKGVAITHGNLSAHLQTLQKVYELDEHSRIFNQLLLCHADGCIQGPVLTAFTGCSLHRPFRFSIEKITDGLDYIYAHNVTHVLMVPAMLNMLVQFGEGSEDSFSYPSFKALISVSAHLDAPVWDKFESTFGVRVSNVYGLTETVAGSLFAGPIETTFKKYTVGKPVDCETRIVDEQGQDVAAGETGELLLRGEHIMKEYWNDADTTAAAFREGWFCTGDLASQDADGFITIRGRKKNLIISGGINIQPEEVTECLMQYEGVSEACALGMADDVFGEKLVAAVVLKPGATVSSLHLVEFCRKNLDDKKVPHRIEIMKELPKGVSGKIQLNALKELMMSTTSVGSSVVSEDNTEGVLRIASDVFQVPAGSLSIRDTSYSVAGWDSLAHLIFITALEEKFDVRFSTAEIMTMNSIAKAVDLVNQKTCIAVTAG